MGLKIGLQFLANYADDAARLAVKSGDDVTRAVTRRADNAISVFGKKTDDLVKTGKATVTPQVSQASAVASHSVDEAGNVVLKEHGLSEIMKETVHTPTPIGQTPVHSPIIPELPEHYIKVEGEVIPFEYDSKGRLAASYKITPSKFDEYTEISDVRYINGKPERVSLGQEKYVQFYSEDGYKVGARIKVPRTSKMSKLEMEQMLEEFKKRPRAPKPTSTTPVETWLEKTIKGLAEPQGTASRRIALDDEGNTIVRFLDDKDSFIRKVKIDPNGQVLEYTNFRTLMTGQGLEDAFYAGNFTGGGSFTSRLNSERVLSEVSFDELKSKYMRINEQSRYILDSNGNVVRTIQTKRFTPHIYGKVGETQAVITVDTRSMNNGKFVEDVVLSKGDKRFSRSFWFDQKTGSIHQMDGWCKGLTKEEIELITSDPYLASRYIEDGLNFVRTEKFNSYRAQNLRDRQIPILFNPPRGREGGHYCHGDEFWRKRHINIIPSTVRADNKPWLVNTLNHEPRHGFQYQMVDDLNAGLLQGEEKAQAEIFADNFDHYINIDTDYKRYRNQPVEVDARHYGEIAQRQFEEFGEKIDKIFFDA